MSDGPPSRFYFLYSIPSKVDNPVTVSESQYRFFHRSSVFAAGVSVSRVVVVVGGRVPRRVRCSWSVSCAGREVRVVVPAGGGGRRYVPGIRRAANRVSVAFERFRQKLHPAAVSLRWDDYILGSSLEKKAGSITLHESSASRGNPMLSTLPWRSPSEGSDCHG